MLWEPQKSLAVIQWHTCKKRKKRNWVLDTISDRAKHYNLQGITGHWTKKRNTEVRDWRSLNANKWSSGLASMLFWCLDLPVSSPTLAVTVEWFSLSLRENELGLEPLLVAWYHDLSAFSIPRQGARSNSWYPFTWLGACWTIPAPRGRRGWLPGEAVQPSYVLLINSCLHLFEQEKIATVLRLYCMKCDARQVWRRINTTSDRWHQWRACLRLGVFFHWIVFIFAWRDVWIASFRFTFWTSAGKQVIFST